MLRAPCLALLLTGTALLPAAAQSSDDMRATIPNLEGAEPSNVPENLKDPKAADVAITGHVLEPAAVEPTPERLQAMTLPDGFAIDVFAEDLGHPRMIAVSEAGHLYVTDRQAGTVTLLKDEDDDGRADSRSVVAQEDQMHGIAFDGDTAFLMTVTDVFSAPVAEDGTLGELTRIATDFPEGGQHPNRTLTVGPDGMLYISVGSTCNACGETNDENATMVRMAKDGSQREIFASGLRNTIGFGFKPGTEELYGFDHGIDWLGDDEQPEEFNRIQEGKQYGWPYVYADSKLNPQDEPPEGKGTNAEWAEKSTEPVLMYTPHAAPMQMTFYQGNVFPEAYEGDAFAAMRGSWNRKPPSGYEVVRVRFEDGKPAGIEPFVSGFLIERDEKWEQMGRLAGLATGPDGALYLSDDVNGRMYRISYDREAAPSSGVPAPSESPAPQAAPAPEETPVPETAPAQPAQ
ncbi:PQQ-dependent sugar dehydrogenase [Aurantimonas sp. 22II-16-19i]|uniref:PQQ-dependent sugar dehydrogenase n=1 Tax=Aurantimonas sp. 22II-16-19i TaxID=1317114 RepID=UPI0009F7BC2E|nr:PQQ-dependent sugar dehydrogenase [Aurantimonas sp. 22II-16-19i]ORE86461.1 PEBP family protein [Aurantimonas sp. 22II-16-19i]